MVNFMENMIPHRPNCDLEFNHETDLDIFRGLCCFKLESPFFITEMESRGNSVCTIMNNMKC